MNNERDVGFLVGTSICSQLGLLKDGDQSTFDDLREKELKHGRISMLAVGEFLTIRHFRARVGCMIGNVDLTLYLLALDSRIPHHCGRGTLPGLRGHS